MQFLQISIRRYILVIGILTIITGNFCPATTLKKLGLNELTTGSDTVVVGRCESIRTVWQDRKIYTIANVRVSKSIKGACKADERILVYILGGRVQKPMPIKMHVPGAAKVSQGEEMVLFLESWENKQKSQVGNSQALNNKAVNKLQKQFRLVGMSQGKIPIRTNQKTQKKTLQYGRSLKWVRLVEPAVEGKLGRQVSNPGKSDSLESFIKNVKQIIEKQKAKSKKTTENTKQPDKANKEKKGRVQ